MHFQRVVSFCAVFLSAVVANTSLALELKEGDHYDIVTAKPSIDKKVTEYFNYGCPGCYKSEPLIQEIKKNMPKDATFEAVPFENNSAWKIYVEAFYIADMLGMLEKAHERIYHRVHVENNAITNKSVLKDFFISLGADPKKFDQAANSFQLNTKLRMARKQAISHKVFSTPSFVVNDHYRVNSRAFKTNGELIEAITILLNK